MLKRLPASLTARLVMTVVALVTLASLLIAAAATVGLRASLLVELDREVDGAVLRTERGYEEHRSPGPPDEPEDPAHERKEARQGPGTVSAFVSGSDQYALVVTSTGDVKPLSDGALRVLRGVPLDGRPHTVELPDLGHYRVKAREAGDITVVAGLPTARMNRTVGRLISWELMCALLGLIVAGGAALLLVRRQLRPLREVARTAYKVSRLPLAEGEIGMTARVPDHLTDERTEVGQVGAALNTLLGHVEEALDSRHRSEQQVRQFVADASHELRTPLATIQGYAELGRRGSGPDPERMAHVLTKVEAESNRMSSLVEDLLLLARLDSGRPLERNEVDLTKLALESVHDAHVVAPGHRWVLDLADEPVVVTGDELRLHQVITNLLGNARRHTPAGTTVIVGVHTSDDGAAAVVTVRDDGPGISEELQSSVFERFSRGDSARTRASGGVGLGLSLVQAITHAHGGEVTLHSRPGSTCFTLTLPL